VKQLDRLRKLNAFLSDRPTKKIQSSRQPACAKLPARSVTDGKVVGSDKPAAC
jgi:hypothetical protein